MAERYRHSRQAGIRQPLSEISNNANTSPSSQQRVKGAKPALASSPLAQHLPHNESLEANGLRHSSPNSSETRRVSQITSEHERDSKRNSAMSTTSTNASGRRRKTYIGHWQLGKTIGKGGCSRVRVVRHRYRDQYGAVKIITRSTAESTRAQSLANLIESTKGSAASSAGHKPIPFGLEREIAVMKLLEHPNIVRLYDVWENRNELYLIMEYVDGGELFHFVDETKGLPEDETVFIFRQVVSALLYCHRLRICHRDLKPENILLNQSDLTVKLIDFGMAALQPEGRLLSTPCGSPHYAAPEVVSSRPYDGTLADVWSCGVILYVMLTGTTPYNYSPDGDIRVLFRDIARAKYWMPPSLSAEAKDLIERIFIPDPNRRINMDGVWDHPLLHKYDRRFGFEGDAGSKEAAIGPAPTVDQWKVKRIQDIDREILRNMRTLWHSEPEQSLVQKLLNNDYNQEKLFYAALVKHREEHLESYVGNVDGMEYSASDYHHSHTTRASDMPPVPTIQAPRSQSQYSIMNDEHLRRSHSFFEPPPSVSSYDPYRASKDPIINELGEYVNVVVHRHGSASTRRASVGRSLRHPNALRIEMLKAGSQRRSNLSNSSIPRSRRSRVSIHQSSTSRSSLTSSAWPSSPPIIASTRPSDRHRRGVSFGHIHRTSTASATTSAASNKLTVPATPRIPDHIRASELLQPLKDSPTNPSPSVKAAQAVQSRKSKAPANTIPVIRVRRPETPHQHIRSEIRKHSAELEKACEEAFFRTSMGSDTTANTSLTDKPAPYDTPPSSVSARGSGGAGSREQNVTRRPLPDLPKDTPTTYLTKTLEETRDKLAAYKSSGDDNTAKFEEVMKMLEDIMPSSQTPSRQDRRNFTAPEAKTPDHLKLLPIISEETSDVRGSRNGHNWHRAVTAPVRQQNQKAEEKTIRMVPPSPGAVAPLNVRKRSTGSESSGETPARLNGKPSIERMSRKRIAERIGGLSAIDEDSVPPITPTVLRKKKSSWFGMKKSDSDAKHEQLRMPGFRALDDREQRVPSRALGKAKTEEAPQTEPPLSAQSSEFPIRKKRFTGAKKGLEKWLGKIGGEKGYVDSADHADHSVAQDTFIHANNSLDSLFSAAASSNDGPPSAGPEQSWFARFFHIKPVMQVLCFSIPRGRARQELVILFREWQRHGIRDIQYSRELNTITARVDRQNSLDIKAVTFRVELFVVLEHGRKVGLSIARFVQVRGAASGFRRVLEVVDGVMRGRGWLLEDEEKWKALCEVVGA